MAGAATDVRLSGCFHVNHLECDAKRGLPILSFKTWRKDETAINRTSSRLCDALCLENTIEVLASLHDFAWLPSQQYKSLTIIGLLTLVLHRLIRSPRCNLDTRGMCVG